MPRMRLPSRPTAPRSPSTNTTPTTSSSAVRSYDQRRLGDWVTVIRPSLGYDYLFDKGAVSLGASAAIGRYAKYSSENYFDFGLNANGRYKFDPLTTAIWGLSLSREHEPRSSPRPERPDRHRTDDLLEDQRLRCDPAPDRHRHAQARLHLRRLQFPGLLDDGRSLHDQQRRPRPGHDDLRSAVHPPDR